MYYWDEIVDSRYEPAKSALQTIRASVNNRFSIYRNHTNANTLHAIAPSPFNAITGGYLRTCYADTIEMNRLRKHINDAQDFIVQGECQYCNLGEPSTLDHYLPKRDFPEFAVLSSNLLPCCPTCNTIMGEEWLEAGDRRIINYYYDQLPLIQYLNCRIVYQRQVPLGDFSLNLAGIPPVMATIISNHFTALDLLKRFKKSSNGEIIDVLRSIKTHNTTLSRAQIQQSILQDATDMQLDRGHNYWRAILRIELSRSNRFLTAAGY